MNIESINSNNNSSFKGLVILPKAQKRMRTKSIEYLNSLLNAKKQLQNIVDYNMVIGDDFEISVEKARPKVAENKHSFIKGLFGKIFRTQEKQIKQKPYNYFKTLNFEMDNAGKAYYRECGDETYSGFYPDIPYTLTELWKGTKKNIIPDEEYAKFKALDDISKAVKLTQLLNKKSTQDKLEQKIIAQKSIELQKQLQQENSNKQQIINKII